MFRVFIFLGKVPFFMTTLVLLKILRKRDFFCFTVPKEIGDVIDGRRQDILPVIKMIG
jgi:hypothetical protein